MFKHWTPCFKLSNQTPSQRSTQNPKAILKYYCVCVRKVREKSTCGTCNPKPREALYPQNPKGNIVYVWKVLVARVTQNPQNPEKHYISPKKQKGNIGNIVYVWILCMCEKSTCGMHLYPKKHYIIWKTEKHVIISSKLFSPSSAKLTILSLCSKIILSSPLVQFSSNYSLLVFLL